ncbi:hypothetical protein [Rivularia sp. UHCC 0363]|uniref:hypothetical protein n=1 Tax=Rivularia sp. UHCC 0363 TaxID=3110244 RepID=UPI002B21D390|nr:hypothetical protein [Rivularia sp. UHCC 0363]MEA5595225.1 hypothetical protein [Rivularia sp. UHCC 0363]
MFNKSLALGLLAAVMVAPGAAFAGSQSQNNTQNTTQNSTAIDGSTSAQSSESLNVQQQIQKTRDSIGRGRSHGFGRRYCAPSYNGQSQNSSMGTSQNGAAVAGSVNGQSSSTVNDQKQVANNSRVCN